MATILYNKDSEGKIVTVKVETKRVQLHLQNGYVCDPAELEEEEKDDAPVIGVDPIRTEAKEAGIRNWHNKRLETLKRELGYVNED